MAVSWASRVLRAGEDPLDVLRALGPAGLGALEEDGEQIVRARLVAEAGLTYLVDPAVHVPATLRASSAQHETADLMRAHQRDLLGDEASHGKPVQVVGAQAQGIGERDRVHRHLGHGAWDPVRGAAHPGVVQQDHLALLGDNVDQDRVPVVDVAAIVLEEHQGQGRGAGVAVAPVGITDAVRGFDALVLGGDLGDISVHD